MHYVIGDVHGCLDELQRLLEKINSSDPEAVFTFVGDFVDRGPKVVETLEWMMKNITPDGKYRCVLGNHEEMVLDWWYHIKDKKSLTGSNTIPLIYGLDDRLKKAGKLNKEYVSAFIKFLESLPLRYDYDIVSAAGVPVSYVITHAYLPNQYTLPGKERDEYLWSREHYHGYPNTEGKILIHGHTPTIVQDYRFRHPDSRPGMIVYGQNTINVDSGCCFFYSERGAQYPCFLSAICLETLEEFYCEALYDRFYDYDYLYLQETDYSLQERVRDYEKMYCTDDNRNLSTYRQQLLLRLGLSELKTKTPTTSKM